MHRSTADRSTANRSTAEGAQASADATAEERAGAHGDERVNEQVDVHEDEFRFLADDAVRVGRVAPPPEVRRVAFPLSSGRSVSALVFAPDPAPVRAPAHALGREQAPARDQTLESEQAPARAAEQSPELVLLHGAGLNAHGFDPALLALDRPALAVDLPGHGRSDWRDDADYRPETLAPDIAEVLDACARTPVTLVGHSLGALTAALVAAARPGLVAGLVMIDITPGVVPRRDAGSVQEFITGQRDFASLEDMVDRAIAFGIGSDRRALTRGVALNTRRRPDGRWEWAHHFAHLDRLPSGAPRATDETPGEGSPDPERPYAALWNALAGLDIPVTLIRADRGMIDGSATAEWRERLPRSAVVTLAGPHNLHEAAPAALAAALRAILPPSQRVSRKSTGS